MTEELEPLWLTVILLRVPEALGCYISLHSARSACRLTVLGSTDLMCQMNRLVANMQRVVFVAVPPRLCNTDYSKHVKEMINCVEKKNFLRKIHITLEVFLEEHEGQQLATALRTNTTVCGLVLH
jgi:hypothetical protein